MSYFLSRPKESQISAWASKQSARISTRQLLEGKFFELKEKFAKGEVPVPTFWGGYRVVPTSIEFWQGGEHRLHDRFLYSQKGELPENGTDTKKTTWDINRLAP
jgi:pyridoxamine 5'-phosphate oxidase